MGRVSRHRAFRELLREIRSLDPRVQVMIARGVPRYEAEKRAAQDAEQENGVSGHKPWSEIRRAPTNNDAALVRDRAVKLVQEILRQTGSGNHAYVSRDDAGTIGALVAALDATAERDEAEREWGREKEWRKELWNKLEATEAALLVAQQERDALHEAKPHIYTKAGPGDFVGHDWMECDETCDACYFAGKWTQAEATITQLRAAIREHLSENGMKLGDGPLLVSPRYERLVSALAQDAEQLSPEEQAFLDHAAEYTRKHGEFEGPYE